MPTNYTIKQGDHLSRIARQFGFQDFNTIWNDGQNARLKQLRKNPNVLLPGDILIIPDKQLRTEGRGTDSVHKFEVDSQKLRLRVRLENLYGKPLADRKYRLLLENDARIDVTNGQGQLEQGIPDKTEFAALQTEPIADAETVIEIPVHVGHLNPVTEVSGWVQRLNNLGYNAGYKPLPDPMPGQTAQELFEQLPLAQREQLRSAIEEFQCDEHLKVDGNCGPATQAQLVKAHGC